MSLPFVSIVMPVRNEAHFVGLSVNSLLDQDYPPDRLEILIIDGMSTDKTRQIVNTVVDNSSEKIVRLIDNPAGIVSTGLNAGIREAEGDVIIRMDAHTEYAKDYVLQCIETLMKTGADNVGGPARTKATRYTGRAAAAAYHSPFSAGGARFHDVDYEGPVDTVTYGCWPKETFERFGLFDEELVRNQDDEHNLRIVRGGGLVWQSPAIRSWYYPRDSLFSLLKQYSQYGYWKVRVIQKHRFPASWRHIIPGAFLLSLCSLLLAGFIWPSAFWILGAVLGLYAICSLLFVLKLALSSGLDMLPILPVVFACYHFGYGYGFLRGILDFVILRRKPKSQWTTLTRDMQKDISTKT